MCLTLKPVKTGLIASLNWLGIIHDPQNLLRLVQLPATRFTRTYITLKWSDIQIPTVVFNVWEVNVA